MNEIYWDRIAAEALSGAPLNTWRAYMRRVYLRLLQRWLKEPGSGRGLKTDLFEEAVSPHHLLPDMGPSSIGLDHSLAIARAARERLNKGKVQSLFIVTDLRRVALRTGAIRRILSGSSLDHFPDKADIAVSLAEVARVLADGGTMVMTFDNPHNPVVWLRNHLPFAWLYRLGLVPYYVGATYNRREARHQLEAVGLTVTDVTAVAHAPRAPAIWLVALAERLGWASLEAMIGRVLDSFESLERWPTRYRTGYYLAFRVEKESRPQ